MELELVAGGKKAASLSRGQAAQKTKEPLDQSEVLQDIPAKVFEALKAEVWREESRTLAAERAERACVASVALSEVSAAVRAPKTRTTTVASAHGDPSRGAPPC